MYLTMMVEVDLVPVGVPRRRVKKIRKIILPRKMFLSIVSGV